MVVYCSDGVRSRRAVRRLAEAGVENLHVLDRGLKEWNGSRDRSPSPPAGPSSWLVASTSLVPPGARTLDVACGRGRHALFLAAAGSMVRAVDRDADRVERLNALARRLRLPLDAEVADLENGGADLGDGEWELDPRLQLPPPTALPVAGPGPATRGGPSLRDLHRGAGARHGRPSKPEHLLEPGELPRLVAPLEVVREREGEFDGRHVASVAARKT